VITGETFAGKYIIERVIGRGGMGFVLAAHHPQLHQTVAVKLLHGPMAARPDTAARFVREARAAARLRNQHVARVMDAGTDENGRQYMVMEYLSGDNLRALYRRQGLVPVTATVGYVAQVCEALAEAHAAGIVHRDLKPENLFLTKAADGAPLIKVLDFGISKVLLPDPSATPAGDIVTNNQEILGSPAYMSPEQLCTPAAVDARTDIWALGVILYELLTGQRPFARLGFAELLADIVTFTPPPPRELSREIPAELSAVVMRCLSRKPQDRFQHIGELAAALAPWAPLWALESVESATRIWELSSARATPVVAMAIADDAPPSPAPSAPPRVRRTTFRKGFVAAAAVAVCALAAFVVVSARADNGHAEVAVSSPVAVTAAFDRAQPAAELASVVARESRPTVRRRADKPTGRADKPTAHGRAVKATVRRVAGVDLLKDRR
jgi:serine/threonine-protein kinase